MNTTEIIIQRRKQRAKILRYQFPAKSLFTVKTVTTGKYVVYGEGPEQVSVNMQTHGNAAGQKNY